MITPLKIGLLVAAAAVVAAPMAWREMNGSEVAAILRSADPAGYAGKTQVGDGSETAFAEKPFGQVSLYQPSGAVRGVVLLLSGDDGWNQGAARMAHAMAAKGALVAGISAPVFLKALEADRASKCINPNFALVALSQKIQNRAGFSDYLQPVVAGYSAGATLSFVALAEAPAGIYRGAISFGFSPRLPGVKPWCAAKGFTASPIAGPQPGWQFGAKALPAPWIVLQEQGDPAASAEAVRGSVRAIPQGELVELPKTAHGSADGANWLAGFDAAFDKLSAPSATAGLPLNIVTDPRAPMSDVMAVLYSGDGGWAGMDQSVASLLAARGIPVVGIDSLRYFWNAKPPARMGQDLGAILAHYGKRWNRAKAIVVGYSFGADALPFAVNAMPAEMRGHIVKLALIGLDRKADFQFHLGSWLNYSGGEALPTVPAIHGLKGMNILCLRGAREEGSACDLLDPAVVTRKVLPGAHHFNGDYASVTAQLQEGVV